ncbi:unnamed protein product [Acanthosepion pharaonis]|uniref:Uncharacterized protein n=1 Tax=Acanthosepion pharaonis TaxID=158019 RepID=A0A812DG25_ACAPH|nr:unnamed protein product [Sepia pharaonis]
MPTPPAHGDAIHERYDRLGIGEQPVVHPVFGVEETAPPHRRPRRFRRADECRRPHRSRDLRYGRCDDGLDIEVRPPVFQRGEYPSHISRSCGSLTFLLPPPAKRQSSCQRLASVLQKIPPDDHSHHLIGAFRDRMHAQIAPEAFDRVIHQIAVAAMELQRPVDHRRSGIGRQPLGHRGEAGLVGRVVGHLGGGEIEQRLRRLQFGRHVGRANCVVLELGDAELAAVLHIRDRLVNVARRPASRRRFQPPPSAPSSRCRNPFTLRAQPVGDGNADVVEHDLPRRL